MTQVALKRLDVITVADRDNSVLMPKIMEAEIGTTHAFDDALEAIIDSTIGQNMSDRAIRLYAYQSAKRLYRKNS